MYQPTICIACGHSMGLDTVHVCPPKIAPQTPCQPVKHFYVTKDTTGAPYYYPPQPPEPTYLTEEQVKQVVERMMPREVEIVERDLSCPTCQRFFCKVRVPKGTPIAAICDGCLREGR